MEKIKLKDYKKDCVCYIDEFEDIQIINKERYIISECSQFKDKHGIYLYIGSDTENRLEIIGNIYENPELLEV